MPPAAAAAAAPDSSAAVATAAAASPTARSALDEAVAAAAAAPPLPSGPAPDLHPRPASENDLNQDQAALLSNSGAPSMFNPHNQQWEQHAVSPWTQAAISAPQQGAYHLPYQQHPAAYAPWDPWQASAASVGPEMNWTAKWEEAVPVAQHAQQAVAPSSLQQPHPQHGSHLYEPAGLGRGSQAWTDPGMASMHAGSPHQLAEAAPQQLRTCAHLQPPTHAHQQLQTDAPQQAHVRSDQQLHKHAQGPAGESSSMPAHAGDPRQFRLFPPFKEEKCPFVICPSKMSRRGFEPPTQGFSVPCSNLLSYPNLSLIFLLPIYHKEREKF